MRRERLSGAQRCRCFMGNLMTRSWCAQSHKWKWLVIMDCLSLMRHSCGGKHGLCDCDKPAVGLGQTVMGKTGYGFFQRFIERVNKSRDRRVFKLFISSTISKWATGDNLYHISAQSSSSYSRSLKKCNGFDLYFCMLNDRGGFIWISRFVGLIFLWTTRCTETLHTLS